MRERPGRIGRVGKGGTYAETMPPEPRAGGAHQPVLPAEEMRRARDIEDQRIGQVQRHHRRIADAEIGKPFEEAPVGRRIMLLHDKARDARAGVSERQAGEEPERFGVTIGRSKP
jgi:hypothetical protein